MTHFRLATTSDAVRVDDLVQRAYAKYIPVIGYHPKPMQCDYQTQTAEGLVHLLVDEQDSLLGLIVLYDEGEQIYIDNVAVEPALQGGGHGKRLLDYAQKLARQQGKQRLTLLTNAKMKFNIALYNLYGFYETQRAPGNHPDSLLVHMAMDL